MQNRMVSRVPTILAASLLTRTSAIFVSGCTAHDGVAVAPGRRERLIRPRLHAPALRSIQSFGGWAASPSFFISVLRFRLGHYLPGDAKAINYDSVSRCKKCFQQRDLDLTTIAESREEPFGFLRSFNSESKRKACKCCFGWRLLATAV